MILELEGVVREYRQRRHPLASSVAVRAVDGVSLQLEPGRTLGVVGESGCGKSTTGRLALGLERPDRGAVRFEGAPLPPPGSQAWRRLRARMQLVPQDPLGALDRRLTIAAQVREPLVIHGRPAGPDRVESLLRQVGLPPSLGARHPHALSGGQRQRAVLARALATEPALLVLDEPVSALDVSIQAGIVNLLQDLQAERGLAMMFISHDLKVVRQVSHQVAVMYLGRVVEHGDPEAIFARPAHPYARALGLRHSRARPAHDRAHRPARRPAQPRRPPLRLRLPSPLPARHAPLPHGRPGAPHARRRPGGGVPCGLTRRPAPSPARWRGGPRQG